jgi:hypothetical protein
MVIFGTRVLLPCYSCNFVARAGYLFPSQYPDTLSLCLLINKTKRTMPQRKAAKSGDAVSSASNVTKRTTRHQTMQNDPPAGGAQNEAPARPHRSIRFAFPRHDNLIRRSNPGLSFSSTLHRRPRIRIRRAGHAQTSMTCVEIQDQTK